MNEWTSVRYLDDDGDGYGGVPFVELSEVVRRMEEHAATVERLRAALRTVHFHTRPSPGFPYGREGVADCAVCVLTGVPIGYAALKESQP